MDPARFTASGIRALLDRRRAEKEVAERQHRERLAAEHAAMHAALDRQDVAPHALERVMRLVERAIERDDREALVMRFPSDFMQDEGRSLTSHVGDWQRHLTGFAARGAAWFHRELEPRGFSIRAAILDHDQDGIPGDAGIFLRRD